MTPELLAHFKQRLEEEKTRLEQELADLGSNDPNRPAVTYPESGGNSDDDNAAEITEYVDDLTVEARLETELRDVKKALESM
jgi:RNA polymerase-binding transcription factor DksA